MQRNAVQCNADSPTRRNALQKKNLKNTCILKLFYVYLHCEV